MKDSVFKRKIYEEILELKTMSLKLLWKNIISFLKNNI